MRSMNQHAAVSTLRLALLIALMACTSFFALPQPAFAAGVVGNGSASSCSEAALRTAVTAGGKVTFNCGSNPVTITLSQELNLRKTVEIDGGGKVTLSGGNKTRIIFIYGMTLTVRNLTFRNGFSQEGGAIRSSGPSTVNVYNSKFYNNSGLEKFDEEGAGAISMHQGTLLRVENSYFEGNRGINGAAIYNLLTSMTVVNSRFVNNDSAPGGVASGSWDGRFGFGGAIYVDGASVKGDSAGGQITIRNSQFIGNKARNHGGAVYTYLYKPDTALMEGLYFENNTVLLSPGGRAHGGALKHHNGPLTLRNSTFVNNRSENVGGAMMIAQNSSGTSWDTSTISNITVTGNRADAFNSLQGVGGGISIYGGAAEIINSTIAGNWADNTGGGINSDKDNLRLRNTIVANNKLNDPNYPTGQCNRTFSNSSNNLQTRGVRDRDCSSGVIVANPLLGSLAANGGATKTMALLEGSPAINRGANCPPTDQRNAPRVSQCDIGAYEYGASVAGTGSLAAPNVQPLGGDGGPLVQANWAPVEGVVYYEIVSVQAPALAEEAPAMAVERESVNLVLDAGSYNVQVRACDYGGCGPFSAPLSVTVSSGPAKIFLPSLAS